MTSASGSDDPSTAPSGSGSAAAPSPAVAGLQRALAAEQQAAFGYALLGPHVPSARTAAALAAQTLHENLRDSVAVRISTAGAVPVAPLGDYPSLYALLSRPLALAARLEDDCAEGWRFAYSAATTAAQRRLPQQQLTASAVRATRWRMIADSTAPITAFPGI